MDSGSLATDVHVKIELTDRPELQGLRSDRDGGFHKKAIAICTLYKIFTGQPLSYIRPLSIFRLTAATQPRPVFGNTFDRLGLRIFLI